MPSLLVLGDSLAFHGPQGPVPPTHAGLYPRVCASALGEGVDIHLHARPGWTMRDAWWALTKDPIIWGVHLPRAAGMVIGVGGMDQLPAAVPMWWRESVPYLRPGSLRRGVRRALLSSSPGIIRATGGRLRQLPMRVTEHYLARIVQATRHFRPDLPIVVLGPSPHRASAYPSQRHHGAAVLSMAAAARELGCEFIDVDPLVEPSLLDGTGNPDGLHWSWSAHEAVGCALAAGLRAGGWRGTD